MDNNVFQCGTVCTQDNCTVLNFKSVFSRNVVTNAGAAALHARRESNITNIETRFEKNEGMDGIIILLDYCNLVNTGSSFR